MNIPTQIRQSADLKDECYVIGAYDVIELWNKEKWEAVTDYLIVITVFALGAGFGGVLAEQYGLMTIWVSPLVLVIVYAMMYHKPIGEN